MSFIAALLTFLFFCHPKLLALIAIVFAIVMLFTYAPAGVMVFVFIAIGILAYKVLVG